MAAAVNGDCQSVADRGYAYPGSLTGNIVGGDTVVGVPARNLLDVALTPPASPRFTVTESQTNLGSGVTDPASGFGSAVVIGDLNADVCMDYVVGAPATGGTGVANRGAVDLILSGTAGPQTTNAVRLEGEHAGDRFGASLALSARLTASGQPVQDDLWVGAPGYRADGVGQAGAIYHYTFAKSDAVTPQLVGIITEATPKTGDHFGAVLDVNYGLLNAAGGPKDSVLMVGTPDRTVAGHPGAGEVMWIRCDRVTGATRAVLALNQDSPSVPGVAETGDHFGAAVSQPFVGLTSLIGIPGEDIGSLTDAGMVQPVVLHNTGSRSIPASLSQDSPGVPGVAERGDQFGASVLNSGPRPNTDDAYAAVGSPGEAVGSVASAGMMQYLPLENRTIGPVTLTQGGALGGKVAAGNRFGASLAPHLAGTDGGGTPYVSAIIGIPGESGATAPAAGVVEYTTNPDTFGAPYRRLGFSPGAVTGLRYGTVLAHFGVA